MWQELAIASERHEMGWHRIASHRTDGDKNLKIWRKVKLQEADF
jgi:hypothetical protein